MSLVLHPNRSGDNDGAPSRSRVAVFFAVAMTIAAFVSSTANADSEPTTNSASSSTSETRWAALVEQSANEAWLRDMYAVILQRQADVGGLDYWLGLLPAGGDVARERVARSFLFSTEGARGEVDRAYQELLNRSADPGGREFWTKYLESQPVTVLRTNILASNERFLRAGSSLAWLDEVYLDLLHRHVDPSGRDFWINELAEGRPRYSVVSLIYHSPEGLGFRVDSLYSQVLGRAPTPTERAAGVAMVRDLNERRLRGLLLASDEYYEQFVASAVATLTRGDN